MERSHSSTRQAARRVVDTAAQQAASGARAAALAPPSYGMGFADGAQAARHEGAFDLQDEDKGVGKEETPIAWQEPSFERQSSGPATPAAGRAKRQAISFGSADYSSANVNDSSTCVEKPFVVAYTNVIKQNDRKLKVSSISGGATIKVNYGGSRNAITDPPASEPEAAAAVTNMKGYYARGSRGAWHTEAASKSHELHHYREWKETCKHYWPTCQAAIEKLAVPKAQVDAEAAIKGQADALISGFKAKAREYWFTLGDGAGDRPYAAGQLKLNDAIKSVQALAKTKKWTVAQGVDTPSDANPTYQPWLPYAP